MRKSRFIIITTIMVVLAFMYPASSAWADDEPEWVRLYSEYLRKVTDYQPPVPPDGDGTSPAETSGAEPSEPADNYLRCFLTLADLDRNGVPELLYGYRGKSDTEILVQVLCILNGEVVEAEGGVIHAAYSLKKADLTLYKTRNGYVWMLQSGGNETPGGRRQLRYTQLNYENGRIKNSHRFTRRWTSQSHQYYVNGRSVGEKTYKTKFNNYLSSIKRVAQMPSASLGGSGTKVSAARIDSAYNNLVPRYLNITKPTEMKIVGKNQTLRLGGKDKATLQIKPAYASAARGPVTWSSGDPDVVAVGSAGDVEATGYGSAQISATLANGMSAQARLTVTRPKATTLKIQAETTTIKDGEQLQLFCVLSPVTARADVIWKSSDTTVAGVDPDTGLVTALNPGRVRIGCWVNRKIRNGIDLVVTRGDWIFGFRIDAPKEAIGVGERMAMSYETKPVGASRQNVIWRSSNPSVAFVSQGGIVTGLREGTTTITATTSISEVKSTMQISVDPGMGTQSGHDSVNGVYQIQLAANDSRVLSVRDHSQTEGAQLVALTNQSTANQRFYITHARDGLYEIRPLCAPMMRLCVRDGALMLSHESEEGQRLFRLARLDSGAHMIVPSSNERLVVAAASDEEGAAVDIAAPGDGPELSHMILTQLSAPDRYTTQHTTQPTPTPDAEEGDEPEPTPEPRANAGQDELYWMANLLDFLHEREAEASSWSHMQLCDLDFSGVPELVIYTNRRERPVKASLTARTGYIYSPETGSRVLERFEYEPGMNATIGNKYPTLRLLVDGASSERRWILADGVQTSENNGKQRFVLMKYADGAGEQELLFERGWQPRRGSGLYETYFHGARECSRYAYEKAYEEYFRESRWVDGAAMMVECAGVSIAQLLADIGTRALAQNWYT